MAGNGMASTPKANRPRLVVTRPAREAADWVARLQEAGVSADALPLIDITGTADEAALAQAWGRLDRYAACLFVSGNAVDFFFRFSGRAFIRLPAGLRFMAPGPGTVKALLDAGVPAAQIDAPPADAAQFDSESLWAEVGVRDWRKTRVLVVRGQSPSADGAIAGSQGRDWIAQRWQAAGATVDFVGVYQRCAPVLDAAQIGLARRAFSDGAVWLFSSSEAVANWAALAAQHGIDASAWREARAIATHPRIAATLAEAGWGRVYPSRPALADILTQLDSIESLHP